MSDLLLRLDPRTRRVAVLERAKGVPLQLLCEWSEAEAGRVYAWLGHVLNSNGSGYKIAHDEGTKASGTNP